MYLYLLSWGDNHVEHLKNISHNPNNRISGELSNHLFETYKIFVRPHGCHIYNSALEMDMAKMFPCSSYNHGLPNWKMVITLL